MTIFVILISNLTYHERTRKKDELYKLFREQYLS